MFYSAKLLHLDKNIEEEVVIEVNGERLVCFSNMLPYGVKEGHDYQVEIIPMVFKEYIVKEQEKNVYPSIKRIDDSFSYIVIGKLTGAGLDTGSIIFDDEVLLRDFGYFDGKMVSWEIDRIDVDFI